MSQNPLIQFYQKKTYGTRDEAVPFPLIQTEHYLPALDFAINEARQKIAGIKSNPEKASFENTFLAMESALEFYNHVLGIYFNIYGANGTPEHQALAKEISPKAAAFASEIALDPVLFARINEVYQNRGHLRLTPEQTRMVEKSFKSYARNGALLPDDKKKQLEKIDQELSVLGPQFAENVLNATNDFTLVLDKKSDLMGLPEIAIEAAAVDATKKGFDGKWLFSLHMPSYLPIMQFSQLRDLRRKMWVAFNTRAYGGKYDNREVVRKTVELRAQRAQLLGYPNYATYVLDDRMATSPDQVMTFLKKLLAPSKKAAEKDLSELKSFKKSIDGNDEVMPWDFAYYSEKLKERKFKFNEEALRPYFKLENVIHGMYEHARRLFGITFHEVHDVPKYHPDVRVFEVREEKTNNYVGLFYTDFFPRETKRGGAWMTTYRNQGLSDQTLRRPHVSIVCNFTKPTPSKPSLLSYDEVQTLFHEFGHALHGLLSNVTYRSLAGTDVYLDFVELPSQIMENWVREKEGLDTFARHYQTGEPIPAEFVDRIKKANQFQAGYYSLRQLNFALLDMAWHTLDGKNVPDVGAFEMQATENTNLLPRIEGANASCAFSHLFDGDGYAAGYYSYKWAEVLDADAFEYFKERGIFNREVADSFKQFILSRGDTEHPMELYKKFRGREPDPNALLRRDGLVAQ